MEKRSLWSDTGIGAFPTLSGDIKTDVLIIGGGIAGVLCAHHLKAEGVENILIDKGRVLSGVTENTTAKITAQHGLIYGKIADKYGIGAASAYYRAQKSAMKRLSLLCSDVECDFEECDAYVYSLDDYEKIKHEFYTLEKIGAPADFTEKTELPFSVAAAVGMRGQGAFHPLKLLKSIVGNLKIYENTKALGLTDNGVITDKGKIKAEKIIVATHFPFIDKYGLYFLKLYQHRSYVLALEGARVPEGMYVDESETGLSFRGYKNLLLLGGGSHRTGAGGGGYKELLDFSKATYPKTKAVWGWAAQDCMSLDGMPYIGRYSKLDDRLYVATGFNKWGMTSAMLSGMILSDMILGVKNEYAELFSPMRSMLHKQLLVNIGHSVKGLLTPTAPRCTHLGCALKYNKEEHSWDCPCHGSRFEKNGEVINNPANRNHKSFGDKA